MPTKKKDKKKKKRMSKKGGSVWCTCITLIHPVKPKKKKKRGRQHIYTQLAKKLKMKCRQFCQNIFGHFSLLFSPQFRKNVFWWGRREKLRAPPKSLPFSTLNQITTNTIFSPLFSSSFSTSLSSLQPNEA